MFYREVLALNSVSFGPVSLENCVLDINITMP